MKPWLSWRTWILSTAIGTVLATALFFIEGKSFRLSGLDLFFAITTVISLGFNLWQLFRDRYKYEPLKNSLIGLFNDIKSRELRANQRQMLLTSPAGRAASVEATQLEFYDFCYESTIGFQELREHVVAAVHTLDPTASSQQVFRAAEFGLTEQERQFRQEGMARYIQKARAEVGGTTPPGNATPTPEAPRSSS